MEYCSDFRYDLEVGQVAENAIGEMLANEKIEVKRDMKAKETGNIFIEYESRGKPSGIATTQSKFYCFVVEDLSMFYPTDKLKDLIRPMLGTWRDTVGGDNNTSKGILFPLKQLIP
jgi:hypothetical protein